jgi:hypothetical protein
MEKLTDEQREVLAPFFDDYAVKFSRYKAKTKLEEETLGLLNDETS